MSQDITRRREHERELERQRERLAALNNLNEVVRDIVDAVIDQSTREEIETIVCERLAAADSYEFAWMGSVDPHAQSITPRVEAGVDGYLEDIPLSTDPDDPTGRGPGGRAVRTREIQVTNDALTDPAFEPWRGLADQYGYRSAAAIPVVHGDTMYGLLGVYADRPQAFDDEEREVIAQLGEVVGHAIAATERKRALMSDELVELQFIIPDVFETFDVDVPTAGTITLDHAVPIEDDEFIVYGSAPADAVESVAALVEAVPHWVDLNVRNDGPETDFELRLSEPPLLSTVATVGGSVEHAVIEDGNYRVTVHLAPGADVRQVIDTVQVAYPSADMVRRQDVTRRDDATERVQSVLTTDLTDRQRASLEAAFHAGFFEWPRDASGEDVAESLDVAPPTFHQHLRKAERKVFESVFSTPPPT